jgi:hypothetical protein
MSSQIRQGGKIVGGRPTITEESIMSFKTGRRIGPRLGLAVCAFLVAAGTAQARPDTRAMFCAQAQSMVYQYGSVVMTTGQHTFQKFVAGGRFCDPHEWSIPVSAATKDAKKCPLLTCRNRSFDLFDRGFRWGLF